MLALTMHHSVLHVLSCQICWLGNEDGQMDRWTDKLGLCGLGSLMEKVWNPRKLRMFIAWTRLRDWGNCIDLNKEARY